MKTPLSPPTIGDRLTVVEDHLITILSLSTPTDDSVHRSERRQALIIQIATTALDELYWAAQHSRAMATPAPDEDHAADDAEARK